MKKSLSLLQMRGTMIHSGLLEVADGYKGILLDAYGVFWGGNAYGALPGAKEVMEKLVASGKWVGILSNATQLAGKEIEKLELHGFSKGKHFHFLITSGEVSHRVFLQGQLPFLTPRKTFWIFGGVHPHYSSHKAIFEGSQFQEVDSVDEADFIYLSVPHKNGEDQTDPQIFQSALSEIMSRKLPMVCSNPDRFAHEGKPPKAVVRQGSIAVLYEQMGGYVYYIGKPHKAVYEVAMDQFRRLGISEAKEILMVGDTPETDIRGARGIGMPSALVMTGIMGERIAQSGVQEAIDALKDHPDYFLDGLSNAIHASH